jgi:hypothetical protein
MKKVFLALLVSLIATAASAQWHQHLPRTYYVHDDNWVAPLIFGGIAGALITREVQQQPVIVQQQPVIVQQQPQVFVQREPVCSEWKEIQQPDGRVYRERSCYQK